MENAIEDLKSLFQEAKDKSEFDFVLTLINYKGMGTKRLTTYLYEWFDAIEFYKELYFLYLGKEKTRIALLIYSAFFENSDFYNIIGSLCKIKLGLKGSSYLFWKTKKYERLLGIGEKKDFLIELLNDVGKENIILFFENNHYKDIRNTFFHSAYSLSDEEYIMHDSEGILINGMKRFSFDIETFFYPIVENVIAFFDEFKMLYINSFNSYKENSEVIGLFPNPSEIIILGSDSGLKGFKIKNAVQFYDKWHDSGIWHEDEYDMWVGHNINMYFQNIETIEILEQLSRYESKEDINKNDSEFFNLVDKIKERSEANELYRATYLLLKFGNIRNDKMNSEENHYKKQSYPKIILPYYEKALEVGSQYIDAESLNKYIIELKSISK